MKWNNMNVMVLRWPEPDATGGADAGAGDTAVETPPVADTPETVETEPAAEPGEPGEPGEQQKTDEPSEIDAVLARYAGEDDDDGVEPEDPKSEEAESAYEISWPEGYEPPEAFAELATREAKAAGVDGAVAGRYTASVMRALQEEQNRTIIRQDAELKEEWGSEYEANLKVAQGFLKQAQKDGALDADTAKQFRSPRGMKLLFRLSQYVGEAPVAGLQKGNDTEKNWAKEVMTNPKHPDFAALRTFNHPRFKEVNARYNKAMGL